MSTACGYVCIKAGTEVVWRVAVVFAVSLEK